MKKIIILLLAALPFFTYGQMNGTYIIDPASPSFPTFNSAILALQIYGINGPVIFEVVPGDYEEKLVIPEIPGSSPVNTVTFRSQTMNRDDVLMHKQLNSKALIILNGTDNIYFEQLSFAVDSPTIFYNLLQIQENCNNLKFSDCRLQAPHEYGNLVYTLDDNNNDGLQFTGNEFINAKYAIYLDGQPAQGYYSNINISGNTFITSHKNGIYIKSARNVRFERNTMDVKCGYSDNYESAALWLEDVCDTIFIKDNIIRIEESPHGVYGIHIINTIDSLPASRNIVNNMIKVVYGDWYCAAISLVSVKHMNVYHNSMYMASAFNPGTMYSRSLRILSGNDSIIVLNNIIYNEGKSVCIGIYGNTNVNIYSDYNVLYNYDTIFSIYNGISYYTLNEWVAATGQDHNSTFVMPDFMSPNDMHLTDGSLAGLGLYLGIFIWDIDGDYRPHPPTPGADEFVTVRKGSVEETGLFFSIYPNPAGDQLTLNLENMDSRGNTKVNICNMQGQLIHTLTVSGKQPIIDVSTMPAGMYLLHVTNSKSTATGRFMKE